MKKTVLALMVLCFLAGCAQTGEQKDSADAGKKGFRGLPVELQLPSERGLPVEVQLKGEEKVPVELQLPDDKGIPVKIETKDKDGIPVKVHWPEGAGKPVKVEVQGDKALPVKVEMRTDRALPVEMKITRKTLILLMIPVGVSLLAAIGACAAAVAAWRSARNTKVAAKGQLYFTLMKDYSSRRMRDDLRRLTKWKKKKVDESNSDIAIEAKRWVEELFDEGSSEVQKRADDIDLARRHVTSYFLTFYQLKKYVREAFLQRVCKALGGKILDIVFPLEEALIEHIGKENEENPEEIAKNIQELKEQFMEIKKIVNE